MTTQAIDLIDELPTLTEVVSDSSSDNLPILTDVVIEPVVVSDLPASSIPAILISEPPLPRALSAEEMQQLLQHIESHLEAVFTSKLNSQLERLQHLAVDLAISELKAELPQLLREALKTTDVSRPT